MIRKFFFVSFLFFYFIINAFLLSDYGMSWDEPVHYQRGQVYLQYFLTGNGDKFTGSKLSLYQKDLFLYGKLANLSFYLKSDDGHPPLNGILSAVSNRIFYQNLGILGDIESYHLFIVLTSVFLAALIFYWVKKEYGIFPGVISFLSLTLYPLFFSESHFNIKDPVETSFFAATIIFFYKGITGNSWKWIIISSIFSGFALATKFNILFSPLVVLPWLIIYKWKSLKYFKWPFSSSVTKALFLYLFISFGILIASWPYLWSNPLGNFLKIIGYYKSVGYGITYQPSTYEILGGINSFALQWILYTTPLIILFLSIMGVLYSLGYGLKEKNKLPLLILLWLIVPIFRVSLPKAGIIGGVREIMEYIPAMAILSGIGANYLVGIIHGFFIKANLFSRIQKSKIKSQNYNSKLKKLLYVLVVLSFIPIALKLISIHPNENVYFNPLIGGLKGAKEKNIANWGNTFGNVYKQGVDWLNKNTEKESFVVRGVAYEDTIPGIWFRPDLKYSNAYQSGMEKKGEYIIELTHDMPVWSYYYYFNYVKNTLNPLYEIKVDDVAILTIWKNDWQNTKSEFKKEEKTIRVEDLKTDQASILMDLHKEIFLTGTEIVFYNSECNFTNEGYFITSDSKGKWTNHPGNLGEIEFYKNFNPREKNDRLSYLFPAITARYIKIVHSEKNDCFKNIKEVYARGIF